MEELDSKSEEEWLGSAYPLFELRSSAMMTSACRLQFHWLARRYREEGRKSVRC